MSFLDKLFKRKKSESVEVDSLVEVKPIEAEEDPDEIVAVIAATLAAMDEEEEIVAVITAAISVIMGKGTDEFIVRNIKPTPEMDSIWAHAGRMKLMR
ncbi:MAG: OadG family protein [Tissierellia bacterium]|nr:OadG family protein [Tissierellia bacterium]